jgi:F-box and WD-40 domain protein 1/11
MLEYKGHAGLVRSLFLDAANNRVLSGSYDQSMRVYDYTTGEDIAVYPNWTTSWILSAKSDYRRIVATSQDGRALLLDFGYGIDGVDMLRGANVLGGNWSMYEKIKKPSTTATSQSFPRRKF